MSNEITAPDGSKWQWKDGEWVKADVKRGPLGGELKRLGDLKWNPGQEFVIFGHSSVSQIKDNTVSVYLGSKDTEKRIVAVLGADYLVETNVPPRLSGERMTAGEAARVPGIVGRWVALEVGKIDNTRKPLGLAPSDETGCRNWVDFAVPIILLPEGFGE